MKTLNCAEIAQLVEQRFRKAWVVGSSPTFGSVFDTLQDAACGVIFFGFAPFSAFPDFTRRRYKIRLPRNQRSQRKNPQQSIDFDRLFRNGIPRLRAENLRRYFADTADTNQGEKWPLL